MMSLVYLQLLLLSINQVLKSTFRLFLLFTAKKKILQRFSSWTLFSNWTLFHLIRSLIDKNNCPVPLQNEKFTSNIDQPDHTVMNHQMRQSTFTFTEDKQTLVQTVAIVQFILNPNCPVVS